MVSNTASQLGLVPHTVYRCEARGFGGCYVTFIGPHPDGRVGVWRERGGVSVEWVWPSDLYRDW